MNNHILIAKSITSEYQFIALLAYINSLNGSITKSYVSFSNYWGKSNIPRRYLQKSKELNVQLVQDKADIPSISQLIDGGFVVHLMRVNGFPHEALFHRKKIKRIIIGDGLGTYGDFFTKLSALIREDKLLGIKSLVRFLISFIAGRVLELLYDPTYYMIFDKRTLAVNYKYINDLKHLMIDIPGIGGRSTSGVLIFITQPLVKLNLLSEKRYLNLLKGLEEYANTKGLNLKIKPHPAETSSWYEMNGYKTIDFDGVVEDFALQNPNYEYIALISSALLTLPFLLNKDIHRILIPELEKSIKLSADQKKILDKLPLKTLCDVAHK